MEESKISDLLCYCPASGAFLWRENVSSRAMKGNVAGTLAGCGYKTVSVGGVKYYAHRLAWFIHYGEWPKHQIDHINGERGDNRISNLRDVTNRENSKNKRLRSDNTSGHIGVYWHKRANKWMASIKGDERQIHLGLYENKEDAISARVKAANSLGYHKNDGRS